MKLAGKSGCDALCFLLIFMSHRLKGNKVSACNTNAGTKETAKIFNDVIKRLWRFRGRQDEKPTQDEKYNRSSQSVLSVDFFDVHPAIVAERLCADQALITGEAV